MSYQSTLLPTMESGKDEIEVRKAILDLLLKINQLSVAVESLTDRVKTLEATP